MAKNQKSPKNPAYALKSDDGEKPKTETQDKIIMIEFYLKE